MRGIEDNLIQVGRRFELIEISEGQVRTDTVRYVDHHRQEAARTKIEKYEKLLETIKYIQMHQNGLMTTMERH